jgi:hypothetical protein
VALTRSIGAYDDGTAAIPGVGTTPLDTRKSLSALWASAGVVTGGPSPLVTGTSGFAYSVAGPVPFVTTRGPSDGFQMFTNDGAVTVPITNAAGVNTPGAPGSGLQRIDILWVRHPTNTENADTSSAPIFGVESGTAVSSSPAAPSIPVGALELARNTMTSAATSTASTGNTIAQTAAVAALRASLAVSAKNAALVGPFSTATTIVQAPAVVADGIKKFKITATFRTAAGDVVSDLFSMNITEVISGTVVSGSNFVTFASTVNGIFSNAFTVVTADVPAAGSRTYRLDSTRIGGTGTATVYNSEIIVERIS